MSIRILTIIGIIAALAGLALGYTGYAIGNAYGTNRQIDWYEDDRWYDEQDSSDWEAIWSDETDGDWDGSWDYDEIDYNENGQAGEEFLLTWDTGLGSAGELDGNIVIVSIFADDDKTSWNFKNPKDYARRVNVHKYLELATAWITKEAGKWDRYPVFLYDWKSDPNLYYEVSLSGDITGDYGDPTDELAQFIEEEIDTEALLKKYDADSIVYLAYFDTSLRNTVPSFTLPYDDNMPYDVEICYLLLGCDWEEECPAAYAHEILHAFGAPDLYTSDYPEYNYNINDAFVSYCEENYPNEIMLTVYDADTGETYYDRISNELTELTAYYIGWTDTCADVEAFHLQESQHLE